MRISRPLCAALLAVTALGMSGSAHALGRLADVQVLDRTTGEWLPIHAAQGRYWVAGAPGRRYAIVLHNRTDGRLLHVIAVDGVNAVSGQTAAWDQTGYVLGPGGRYDIRGWRKSDAEIAAFEFTSLGDSYAARTGRPANVGVIGVAIFREQAPPEPVYRMPEPILRESPEQSSSMAPPRAPAAGTNAASANAAASAADSAADAEARPRSEAMPAPPAKRARREADKLGTGHGARENAWVGHTEFERAQTQPDEIITIHYDSRENLIAMGVLPPARPRPEPNAFPGSMAGYVPDPPARR